MPARRNTPKYKIKVEGQDLPAPVVAALREIVVDRAVDMGDMFSLTFENERCRLSDDETLKPGKKIEIELGYEEGGGRTINVCTGEITAVKAAFPRRGPLSVKLQGYTKVHRLQRGRQTRAFKDQTYAQIAQAIAAEVGLEAEVDPTDGTHEYVFQRNQTNLEFLLEIGTRVGYEVFVSDGKLHFRKPKSDGAQVTTLTKGENLLSFNPQIRAARVPSEVKAQGFDARAKKTFTGTATRDDAGPLMGGKTAAPAVAEKLGPAPKGALHALGLKDQAQARAVATSALRSRTQHLVHATATVAGAPELKPGTVVEIDGVGDIFSGLYYIQRLVHTYVRDGFSSQLSLRRSSLEKAPAPPPAPPAPPAPAPGQPGQHEIFARLIDEATGRPIGNARYEVRRGGPQGEVVATGTTDWEGNVSHRVDPGQYAIVHVPERPAGGGGAGGAGGSGATSGGGGTPGQTPGPGGGSPAATPPATPPPAEAPSSGTTTRGSPTSASG